jgi:hypothetical protein
MSDLLSVLEPWIEKPQATTAQVKVYRKVFRHFIDWCNFHRVPTPADALDVAQYLLDLVNTGVPFDEIELAARAIRFSYDQRPEVAYLDPRPIKAALAVAEAQSGHRVLH